MISIERTKHFKSLVKAAGCEAEVHDALVRIRDGFGNRHLHAGLSIRKLGRRLYECRTSLAWRPVFMAGKGVLTFDFAGDHDAVRKHLRGRR